MIDLAVVVPPGAEVHVEVALHVAREASGSGRSVVLSVPHTTRIDARSLADVTVRPTRWRFVSSNDAATALLFAGRSDDGLVGTRYALPDDWLAGLTDASLWCIIGDSVPVVPIRPFEVVVTGAVWRTDAGTLPAVIEMLASADRLIVEGAESARRLRRLLGRSASVVEVDPVAPMQRFDSASVDEMHLVWVVGSADRALRRQTAEVLAEWCAVDPARRLTVVSDPDSDITPSSDQWGSVTATPHGLLLALPSAGTVVVTGRDRSAAALARSLGAGRRVLVEGTGHAARLLGASRLVPAADLVPLSDYSFSDDHVPADWSMLWWEGAR